mgnify:CR=1 FL=1
MELSKIEKLERHVMLTINGESMPSKEKIKEYIKFFSKVERCTKAECNRAFDNIIRKLSVTIDKGVLIKSDIPFERWYKVSKYKTNFKFWNRYEKYLNSKGWNDERLLRIDEISDDIMDLLGNPNSKISWKRRGLIIGDVQSGKTANYSAICNKAVDSGYKVIIILTGMIENLRKQTQDRQDRDLVGIESFSLLNENRKAELNYEGVGKIDDSIKLMTFTSNASDFNNNILKLLNITLNNCSDSALFVVKKNKAVLENLNNWLVKYNSRNGIIDSSVLVIDDECDNASVNTKNEEDPTTINRCIRNLLKCFKRQSYIAVTATPYANIFINPEINEESEKEFGQDLFPRDFIYCLPSPSDYIGAKDIFLKEGRYYSSLEIITDAEDIIGLNHKKDFNLIDMPGSLYEAIEYFILITSIRDSRGQNREHSSMLVNISRFTDVQNQFADKIDDFISIIKKHVKLFCRLSREESNKDKYIRSLYHVWEKYELGKVSEYSWDKIRKNYIQSTVDRINVQAINQSTQDKSIPYDKHSEGYRVIAVGGNSLSRGITLEGLCTTYFYRNSKTYDTLMQMGRWFGYRMGYEDLFKIWMPKQSIEWYGTICEATEELKGLVKKMNDKDLTPETFGLMVREDPVSLMITAPNKMKHTKLLKQSVNLSGRVVETIKFNNMPEILNQNYKIVKEWTENLFNMGIEFTHEKGILFKGVDKKYILSLIDKFESAITYLPYNKEAIIECIEDSKDLENWDVIITEGSSNNEPIKLNNGNIGLKREIRKLNTIDESDYIKIYKDNGRILTGDSLNIGINPDRLKEINEKKERKERVYIREYLYKERNPLLFVHFIDASKYSKEMNSDYDTLVAISLCFPVSENGERGRIAVYRLNEVAAKQFIDIEELDD